MMNPLLMSVLIAATPVPGPSEVRPNIVWIIAEDMSPHFGCYGETTIATPNVDRLAAEGVRFAGAYVTAPVCSASRSALITGMYQTSIGAHHHRSGRGALKITLPEGVALVPALFQEAGYYTSNGTIDGKPGKTDYNFEWDQSVYDGADWSGRADGQPFFSQIQLDGGKLRHAPNWAVRAERALGSLTDPDSVSLPPYYPRDPVLLDDWARYLDTVRYTDSQVGRVLDRLEEEGLLESTVVFFITDHGISHARGKQFLYEEGTRIPMIVRGPGLPPGSIREDLVAHIDMAAASLELAGITPPAGMQGRPLFSEAHEPRTTLVTARDRCDETVDGIRGIRADQYKLILNRYSDRPYLQPNAYKDHKEILVSLRSLQAAGELDEVQSRFFGERRPRLELYDLHSDPWEVCNLAADPERRDVLDRLLDALGRWVEETGDLGKDPESAEMYESDLAASLRDIRRNDPDQAIEIESNIRVMMQWASDGK